MRSSCSGVTQAKTCDLRTPACLGSEESRRKWDMVTASRKSKERILTFRMEKSQVIVVALQQGSAWT